MAAGSWPGVWTGLGRVRAVLDGKGEGDAFGKLLQVHLCVLRSGGVAAVDLGGRAVRADVRESSRLAGPAAGGDRGALPELPTQARRAGRRRPANPRRRRPVRVRGRGGLRATQSA